VFVQYRIQPSLHYAMRQWPDLPNSVWLGFERGKCISGYCILRYGYETACLCKSKEIIIYFMTFSVYARSCCIWWYWNCVKWIFFLIASLDNCILIFWICWSHTILIFCPFPWLLLCFIKHFIHSKTCL
jgi:hypothetical protein